MNTFFTYNQFNDRYNLLGFDSNRNACPLFALITAHNFMNDHKTTLESHVKALDTAITNMIMLENIPKYLSFTDLLEYTPTLNEKEVIGTTPELVKQYGILNGIVSDKDSAIIILKNGNFFVILISHYNVYNNNDIMYCVRDCHENEQYDFMTIDLLNEHLAEKYQFDKLTVVDGILIEEYGNIEYIIINKQFDIKHLQLTYYDIFT
jgi:hypothetical protein